jgi:hypothetical protein
MEAKDNPDLQAMIDDAINIQSRGQKLKGLIKLTIKVKDIKTWRLMQSICAHTTSVLNARCLISEE